MKMKVKIVISLLIFIIFGDAVNSDRNELTSTDSTNGSAPDKSTIYATIVFVIVFTLILLSVGIVWIVCFICKKKKRIQLKNNPKPAIQLKMPTNVNPQQQQQHHDTEREKDIEKDKAMSEEHDSTDNNNTHTEQEPSGEEYKPIIIDNSDDPTKYRKYLYYARESQTSPQKTPKKSPSKRSFKRSPSKLLKSHVSHNAHKSSTSTAHASVISNANDTSYHAEVSDAGLSASDIYNQRPTGLVVTRKPDTPASKHEYRRERSHRSVKDMRQKSGHKNQSKSSQSTPNHT